MTKSSPARTPELTWVLVGPDRKLAIIDGRIMAEGEERYGMKVWQISSDAVRVSVAGRKPITLQLNKARVEKVLR